jgi:hypothetical protein
LDKFGDELLFSPRKFDGLLEDFLELSGGARASPRNRATIGEQIFDSDAESVSEQRQDIGARGSC